MIEALDLHLTLLLLHSKISLSVCLPVCLSVDLSILFTQYYSNDNQLKFVIIESKSAFKFLHHTVNINF